MRRALLSLATLVATSTAPGALANSGLEYIFITPICILGMDNDAAIKACGAKHPEVREPLRAAHEAWKTRNATALQEISAYCEGGLATLHRDLGLGWDDVERMRKAALRMYELMRQETEKDGQGENRCSDMVNMFESQSITQEELKKTRSIPLSLAFMEGIDPDFLKEPPAGIQANYQRDRKLHFGRSYGAFAALRTGPVSLDANCLGYTVESCQQAHGQRIGAVGELAHRDSLPNGDERVTYTGSKVLFRGTFSDNQPVGREERIFLLRPDKRIKDAWDHVQLLKRPDAPPNVPPRFAYSCEPYGRQNSAICSVRSVDP